MKTAQRRFLNRILYVNLNVSWTANEELKRTLKYVTMAYYGSKNKVELSLCWTKYHAMKTCGVVEVYIHAFLTSELDWGEWSSSRSGFFTPGGRAPGIHRTGGWVGPRGELDTMAKRKNPIIAPAGNQTPVVQPVA
jgi:hypothetical protein